MGLCLCISKGRVFPLSKKMWDLLDCWEKVDKNDKMNYSVSFAECEAFIPKSLDYTF